ncbi:hypothetical protein CWR48_04100 [Oceanobacillus arenosus]|uniref:Maltose/galactoside acetyltransferase domain-containing protein n=1 Tax=Oceanobacillus arenosus TaxID=1229153 RepID=A0A3D8Q2A1_9BACI|nr:maltose acetyltransferase domain-containing protein [Oceanobacillus arenosus]RDW21145.1 hypothetical protein CWR48_04100 [Oceanobacillus arenosus]
MKSAKEKMLAGEQYRSADKELLEMRNNARRITRLYKMLGLADIRLLTQELLMEILQLL